MRFLADLTGRLAKTDADELRKGDSPAAALAMYVHAWNTGYQNAPLLNQMALVTKRSFLAIYILSKNEHFTKTGSGQT